MDSRGAHSLTQNPMKASHHTWESRYEPCETLHEHSGLMLRPPFPPLLLPPNTGLAIPNACATCCHLRIPSAYHTPFLLQVLLQSLLKCLFFRKALPHYLIKNSLCHTLSACWLHFSSDDLHYVFICSLSISTLRVYIPLVKALYLIHLSTLGSRTAPGT